MSAGGSRMRQITVLTGPERRRSWGLDDRRQILAAAFAPGANVREVSRRYDVATSLIYKWRRQSLNRTGVSDFAEVMMVTDPASSERAGAPAVVEIVPGDQVQVRLPTTTPPELAAAIVTALGPR